MVQPWLRREGHQKLGTVRVRTVISHGQDTGLIKLDGERLVAKYSSVDRAAAVSRAGGDVPPLYPRISHHPVEGATLVGQSAVAKARGNLSNGGCLPTIISFTGQRRRKVFSVGPKVRDVVKGASYKWCWQRLQEASSEVPHSIFFSRGRTEPLHQARED